MLNLRFFQSPVDIASPSPIISTLSKRVEVFPLPNVNQFHTALKEALYSPQFLRDGGCLGFDCEHAYVFTSLNKTVTAPSSLRDYVVYSAARSLCLNVSMKLLMEGDWHWSTLPQFSRKFGLFHGRGDDSNRCSIFVANICLAAPCPLVGLEWCEMHFLCPFWQVGCWGQVHI